MVEQRRMRKKRSNENHKFTIWQTVFEVDSKYIPVEAVGEGSYGVVCSSINKETNEKVAIKKLSDVFGTKSDALRTLRELVILRNIRHENVIQLKDVMITCAKSSFTEVYLVYELMDFDLHRVIASPLPLSNDHCRFFLFQLLQGLKYLHSANVLHRDLKPENLFVNANCDLKIGDFGLSRTSKKGKDDENMTEYVVTRWYRAPELLLRNSCYEASIDVWSVGCIFAELLGRKPLFPGKTSLDQLKLIIDVLGSPCSSDLKLINDPRTLSYIKSLPETNGIRLADLYAHVDGLALDLLQKMFVFNPKKRITVTEALQHPYLCQLHSSINDEAYNININKPLDINIDSDINEAKLRELIWREYVVYHPRAAYYSFR